MGGRDASLSVLCADVSAGQARYAALGPAEARQVLERCFRRIHQAVARHGGRLVEHTGSRPLAFFGDSLAALQAAVDMQQRVADLPPPGGQPLAMRVAICAGHQAQESRYFCQAGVNPAARLSVAAAPGKILLSVPQRALRFPWRELAADRRPELAFQCGQRRLGVFEVARQLRDQAVLRLALGDLGNGAERLAIRYRGGDLMLDETQPLLRLGRGDECELLLRDDRCSRQHGSIERRLDGFVFVDRSRNGSYLTLAGQGEIFVHRRSVALFGRGLLSLGAPAAAPAAERLQFRTAGY